MRRSLPCAGLPLCRARCRAPADAVCRLERAARELAGNQPFKNTFDRRSHALARQKDNSWPALHVALTWSCGVRIGGAAQPVMIAVQIRVRVGASRLGGKGGGVVVCALVLCALGPRIVEHGENQNTLY